MSPHATDQNVTLWTQIPHTAWPSKCPRCGAGLSNTSYEPYCAYKECGWNSDGGPVAATLVEAALSLLDEAAKLREGGHYEAQHLERKAREWLRASLGVGGTDAAR